MNKFLASGFIGKKGIEIKTTGTGKMVATYSLAIAGRTKGEYTYINCVTWEKQAEFLKNNEDVIKSLIIEAHVSTRSYDNNEGKKVYVTEFVTDSVEVKEWKNEETKAETSGFSLIEDSDDIPF